MKTEFFKTDDGIYHKIECDYDRVNDPLHPRKDFDNLGKMIFKEHNRYSLGDIQTDEFAEFFEDELKEIDSDSLTEKQLFDLWVEKQFYVLPINIFEHGNIVLHPGTLKTRNEKFLDGSNNEYITNSGFIYVSKGNEEVQEYLKAHSEEETKQWLENVFKGEIELYSKFLNEEVYTISDSVFNPQTLNWDKQNEVFSYYGTEIEYIKETLGAGKYISQNEIQELENKITPEFIKATGEKFFAEIQECLSDFDGNLLYAQKSVFNAWNRESKTELFPNEKKLKALSQFLKDNGCDSPEKTIVFLEKNIKPSQQKTFDPFSYEAEEAGYETWLNPNSNKIASNYNSRISPKHALIIDYQNKRFGILTGADFFSGDRLPNYKKNPMLSGKKFKEKIENLLSEGFVFEKFTGERAEYAQGKLESFFPNKKKINSKENDYERER